jgi:cystathionine beta-lyase
MKHSFDELIDRTGTNSIKWDYRREVFGSSDVLPLWVADMDFACPPGVVEAVIRRAQHPIYGYPGKPKELYEAAAGWILRRFGTVVSTSWMTTVPGIVTGLHMAVEAFAKPGDKVIVQSPVYHPFYHAVENRGCEVVENPLREHEGTYVMDLDDLRHKIDERTKLLILCSPHNPIGRVWTREELQELGEICVERGVIVVSDEIHADLVYEKGKHVPYYSLPAPLAQQSITFVSASKTFNLAGLFSSLAISENSKLLQTFTDTMRKLGVEYLNLFGVEAMTAAYREGEPWLDELLVYLRGNAQYIHRFLQERIPQIKMSIPEATYLGWMDFRGLGIAHDQLKSWLVRKARIGLNDGATFGVQGAGFQRINFACPRAMLVEAMQRLEQAVNG